MTLSDPAVEGILEVAAMALAESAAGYATAPGDEARRHSAAVVAALIDAGWITVSPYGGRITELTFSVLPDTDINYDSYAVQVAWRDVGLYAVTHRGYCMNRKGVWSYERQPSSRPDRWLATHRFGMLEACRLAMLAAPKVVVNGTTAQQVLDRIQARAAALELVRAPQAEAGT